MLEDMKLKIIASRSSSMASITCLPIFTKNLPFGSEIIRGGTQTDMHTDRETGDLISLLSFLKRKLKMVENVQQI
jgi:hypothetical protein